MPIISPVRITIARWLPNEVAARAATTSYPLSRVTHSPKPSGSPGLTLHTAAKTISASKGKAIHNCAVRMPGWRNSGVLVSSPQTASPTT